MIGGVGVITLNLHSPGAPSVLHGGAPGAGAKVPGATAVERAPIRAGVSYREQRSGNTLLLGGGSGVYQVISETDSGDLLVYDNLTLDRNTLQNCPTIAVCAHVISRLFRTLRLQLVETKGKKRGQDVKSHPLLTLFNERPNEYQTPGEFWAQIGEELLFGGECIIRVMRDPVTRAPRRLFIYPYDRVDVKSDRRGFVYVLNRFQGTTGTDGARGDWRGVRQRAGDRAEPRPAEHHPTSA